MPEFDLIRRLEETIAAPFAGRSPGCLVGIGDDGAVLETPAGRQLVVCTDTLVEGVHFPAGTAPRAIGHKSLAVNLSDLAAMGADPAWFFLALTLPAEKPGWLDDFAQGMAALAVESGILLAGGDTTSGPLSVTVTVLGLVEPGAALLRSGAREGDSVAVSGVPGRAARALAAIGQGVAPDAALRAALDYPRPRLALGRALRGLATACIDVSDGLLADLGHVAEASRVGAELWLDRLPRGDDFAGLDDEHRWALQLAGGDDYELCFTVPPGSEGRLAAAAAEAGVPLTVIGRVVAGQGVRALRPDGSGYEPARSGYQHFAANGAAAAR